MTIVAIHVYGTSFGEQHNLRSSMPTPDSTMEAKVRVNELIEFELDVNPKPVLLDTPGDEITIDCDGSGIRDVFAFLTLVHAAVCGTRVVTESSVV